MQTTFNGTIKTLKIQFSPRLKIGNTEYNKIHKENIQNSFALCVINFYHITAFEPLIKYIEILYSRIELTSILIRNVYKMIFEFLIQLLSYVKIV